MGAIKVTVTRSAGLDGAVLVMIDTDFKPDASDTGPGLRVLVNDEPAFVGVAYQASASGEPREASVRTLELEVEELSYDLAPGDLFGTVLAAHGGDKVAAATEIGRGLMAGDPAQFKAGYSRDSAVAAVARLYGLDEAQQAQVREGLPEEPAD